MGRLDGRLTRMEQRLAPPSTTPEFWVSTGDGFMRSATGEMLTEGEFRRRYPTAYIFTLQLSNEGRPLWQA